jgi:hypothetical protein
MGRLLGTEDGGVKWLPEVKATPDATSSSAADLFSVLRRPLCSMEMSRLQIRISEGIDVKPGRGTLKARWITRKDVL